MGFADLLVLLEFLTTGPKALEIGGKVMSLSRRKAEKPPGELALKRGPFPNFEGSVLKGRWDTMRNATYHHRPCGNHLDYCGTSSGIDPIFALAFMRHVLEGKELLEVNPYFEALAKQEGFYSEELMRRLLTREYPAMLRKYREHRKLFVTAHDITPRPYPDAGGFSRNTRTMLFPRRSYFTHEATVDDVGKVYKLAYDSL